MRDKSKLKNEISINRLLLDVYKDLNKKVISKINENGYSDIKPTHTHIFRHISLEGIRLKDLTDKIGLSKQSISEIVDDLEKKGYLVKLPDDNDLRAKKICYTEKGKELIGLGKCISKELEKEYIELLGFEEFENLKQVLTKMLDGKK